MTPMLARASRRHLLRHPWQLGLAIAGVALGVAVVVSTDLANTSARRGFELSSQAVTGRATHQVVGGPGGVPDAVYRRLVLDPLLSRQAGTAHQPGAFAAAPVVEGSVAVPSRPGVLLYLLGVDPFAEDRFRPYLAARGGSSRLKLAPFLTTPGAGVLSAETAARLGVAPGEGFEVRAGAERRRVLLVGLLEPADETSRRALADLLVTDVATAQELLAQPSGPGAAGGPAAVAPLTRIDLVFGGSPGQAAALAARVRSLLPAGLQLLPATGRTRTLDDMTRAFRLNLTALSLLALLCGAFLIYNTMTFSVVQRRTLIGTLRALGVTRREVFALIAGEALAIGLAGTLLGLAGGVALGEVLVRLVTRTIDDLYFALRVRELALDPLSLVKGAALGLGGTLLAALAPALEATSAPPRAVLSRSQIEDRLRRAVPRAAAAGALLALAGVGLLALPSTSLVLSFAGLALVVLGCALSTPAAMVLLMALLGPPMGRLLGLLGRMAARGVVATLSRTAVAAAALMIAVSVTVGVGVMIQSFRQTVDRWLTGTLAADVYITAPAHSGGLAGAGIDPALAARLAALPGVARLDSIYGCTLETQAGPVHLTVLDVGERAQAGFSFAAGDPAAAWPAFEGGGAVLVSEPFAYRRGLGTGAALALPTAHGEHRFPIAGVVYDYASDRGTVMMSRATYERFWGAAGLSGVSLHAAPGVTAEELVARAQATAGAAGADLLIRSNRALRAASLAIFDRTFRITEVLRLLAGLVAFLGVLAALMALELERARELGVLRANGLTPRQVWELVTAETGLLGLAAGLLSIPVGLALAAIMIYVVNRRSFGWTLVMRVDPAVLLEALALAVGAAVLAGLYPAFKMARTSPAAALREE